MKFPIGATSYVFRYLLSQSADAATTADLLRLAKAAGLARLQICENARPLEISPAGWSALERRASDLGLEISLGCSTLSLDTVNRYLDRTEAIGGSDLRIVLETEAGISFSVDRIRAFLDLLVPVLESRRMWLAIENHFAIPSKNLAEAVVCYPAERVGFCLDTANSLRNFEDWQRVFDLLEDRAVCYHLKDFRIAGSNVGFSVIGAPFGEGQTGAAALLRRILSKDPSPKLYLETWTPSTQDPQTDIATDAQWLAASIANLQRLIASERQ